MTAYSRPSRVLDLVMILALLGAVPETRGQDRGEDGKGIPLGIIEDFSKINLGPFQKGFIDSWRWSDEVRGQARQQSHLEVVADDDGNHLKVQISGGLPFLRGYHSLLSLMPYFPPEADAVRIRLKVISGKVRLFLGGPTAYYGNSDVFTSVEEHETASGNGWITIEFSLNHSLWRNFRRAGFSTEATRNYYNRWAQEPLSVYLAEGTTGEFLIDKIELVALGEGRAFPAFATDEVELVKTIASFEDGNLDTVFNLYMADGEIEWFEQSWKRESPLRFAPAEFSIADGGLICSGPVAEEVHCAGIHTDGVPGANAIRITLSKSLPARHNTVVGLGTAEPIDFLVFVSLKEKSFPWESLGPEEELRAFPHRGFDYQLSYRMVRQRDDLNFAIYQARRYLKPDEMTTLILPLVDFTCVYGSGAFRQRYLEHQPLTSEDIIAISWLNPWNRVGDRRTSVITRIEDLAFVKVPGAPESLRSFWQIPRPGEVRIVKIGTGPQQIQYMLLPGEEAATP